MSLIAVLSSFVRNVTCRAERDQQLDDELRSYLDLLVAEKIRNGMAPPDARRAALLELGGINQVKENVRDIRIGAWLDTFSRDLGYAARTLRRAPVFATVVVITLALGIGANAAVLGVIDGMYFRKLPVAHPERIVALYSYNRRIGRGRADLGDPGLTSFADFRDLRMRVRGVEGLASYSMAVLHAGDSLAGEGIFSALVSGNYFDVLGLRAQRGRLIRADEEDPPGGHPVVVISDFLWRNRFGADPTVVGQTIPIGRSSFTIVGVAPAGFTGLHPEGRTDLWLPYTMRHDATVTWSAPENRAERDAVVLGRLSPGATLADVQSSASMTARELAAAYPAADSLVAYQAAVRDRLTTYDLSPNGLRMFVLVWIMIALLHLVACTNIASLMLARAAARRKELGVRLCLGASRGKLVAQSMTEAGLLALFGAAGGLAVARVLSGLISEMQFLSAIDAGSSRIVIIVALVAAATMLQFGLIPALNAARTDPMSVVRGTDRRAARDRSEIVVVVQVAISLVLVASAAVFVQLFERQSRSDPRFDTNHLVMATLAPNDGEGKRSESAWIAMYDDIVAKLAATPGVEAAAAASSTPLSSNRWLGPITIPGQAVSDTSANQVVITGISPGYFATLRMPMMRGREFSALDRLPPGATPNTFSAAIVNETLARRLWPNVDPLRRQLSLGKGGPPITVVGVVRDAHDVSALGYAPRVFFPLLETHAPSFQVVVRAHGDPASMLRPMRTIIAAAGFQTAAIHRMTELRDGQMAASRSASYALSVCANVALLLTATGLYGLVATWAARRRREIGIRLALGSSRRAVHSLLLAGIGRLTAVGAGVGLVCTVGIVRVIQSWLGPTVGLDLPSTAISLALLVAVAGLASLLPAWRATRQSPYEVLRSE